MKILHILDHSIPLHSGYTFRSRAILEQQRKLGWETFQVTSAKHEVAEQDVEEIDGLTFYRSEIPKGWVAKVPLLNQWAIIKSLDKRLDQITPQIKPDVLHAHSPALNGLAALKAGKKFNIPVVYECRAFWEDAAVDHGTTEQGSLRYQVTHALETYVFKKANAVTTICEGLRQDISQRGIPAKKITVIPNAVDIEKFTTENKVDLDLRENLGLTNKTVLGFIGSFYAYEGLPILLDALPIILEKHPDIRLLLVGGGSQESLLKDKVRALKLENNVIFTGRVSHDEVQSYYNQVDIFIYPREPMRLTELVTPLKPLEAMAQGRILIASDVGGHKELIQSGINGRLFKANDKADLVKTVLDLLQNKGKWDEMRHKGREFVEQHRNWAVSVARYKAVYESLLNNV